MVNWFKKKESLSLPAWLDHYRSLGFKPEASQSIDQVIFTVLDCETTGLAKTDQIITIGALKCTSKEVFLDSILDQKYPGISSGKSAEIHGELQSEKGKSIEAHLEELVHSLFNHIIVGHNIAFDISMINNTLKREYGVQLQNKVLDTAQLAMRLNPVRFERTVGGKSQLHLDDLCNEFDISIENRHTALGDAYLTALLFQRLISRLKKRGVISIGELLK